MLIVIDLSNIQTGSLNQLIETRLRSGQGSQPHWVASNNHATPPWTTLTISRKHSAFSTLSHAGQSPVKIIMDPITAVGLASAIISFVPLGIKVLQNAKEIKDSIDGGVKQNATRQAVIEELQALSGRLRVSQSNNINPPAEQVKLLDLASRCHDLSQQILNLLDKVRPKTSTTRGKYSSAVRVWLKEGEIKDLEKSLYNCREQLIVGLVDLSR